MPLRSLHRARGVRLSWLMRCAAMAGLAGALWWWGVRKLDLGTLRRMVRRRYPTLPRISTRKLDEWLQSDWPSPLLLDVRSPKEFEVSHLPGARNVEPKTFLRDLDLKAERATPMVVYCAIGWRASAVVRKLHDAGFVQAWNLDGGIFQWVNEGRAVVRNGRPTQVVHPYSNGWARLLKPDKRAPLLR